MSNFVVILVCLFIGYIFRQWNVTRKDDYKVINTWVIFVGLPAVALRFIPEIEWKLDYVFTGGLPFVIFGFSYLFFKGLNHWIKFSRRTLNTLIIVSGLSNTSFVGFPLIISFFGEEQLKVGIVSDQLNFFTLSTLGVLLAASTNSIFKNNKEKYNFILRRLFTFPPFIACIIGLIFSSFLDKKYFHSFFEALSLTVSPLALFSIGMQLNFSKISKEIKAISLSIFYKLLIAPILAILIAFLLNLKGVFFQVSVFEMAMPCLVASSMVIEKFGLNIKLANTIIGLSIILGLLVSFFWFGIITFIL